MRLLFVLLCIGIAFLAPNSVNAGEPNSSISVEEFGEKALKSFVAGDEKQLVDCLDEKVFFLRGSEWLKAIYGFVDRSETTEDDHQKEAAQYVSKKRFAEAYVKYMDKVGRKEWQKELTKYGYILPKNREFVVAQKDNEKFFVKRYNTKLRVKDSKKQDVLMVCSPSGDGNPILFVIRQINKKPKVVMMMIFN